MKKHLVSLLPAFARPWWARLQGSPLGYRLARGTFWSIVGTLISKGLGLAASVLVARIIGKVGFGELGILQSTVGMLGVFAGLGMGLTANKHVAELRTSNPVRAGRIIGLSSGVAWISGGLMTLTLFIAAPWLAERTLAAPHLAPLLQAGSLLLLFSAVNGAQTGALAGFEAFKRIAYVNLYSGLASFPLVVFGTLRAGLKGAVWGLVISQAFGCLLSFLAIRKEALRCSVPLGFSGCLSENKLLWKFSLPAVFSGAVVGPVVWACNAMIANRPDGYAEMGVFNAANQWRTAIQFLPGMMAMAALPMLSSLQGSGEADRFKRLLWINLKLSFGAAFVAAVPIIICSTWIMAAYGKGFASGSLVLILLSLSTVISATLNVVGNAIASQGRMWAGFLLNLLWAGVMLLSCFGLKHLGAVGLALATLLAYLVHAGSSGIYIGFALRRAREVHPADSQAPGSLT